MFTVNFRALKETKGTLYVKKTAFAQGAAVPQQFKVTVEAA